jgi:hypothetical protein
MSKRTRESFWNAVAAHPFGVLLLSLILMMVLAPCTSLLTMVFPDFHGVVAMVPLSLIVVGASMLALWQRSRNHAFHLFAGGLLIVLLTFGSLVSHHAMTLAQVGAQILFLAYVLGIVVKSVFRAGEITGDILCGAVSVYLLFGVLAGFVFVLIEFLVPGSFVISSVHLPAVQQESSFARDPGWLLYFSFVTLTTVGYGDVLPANPVARSAAVLVAVIGQILLMVQIARLVGMHVAQGAESSRGPRDRS